MTTSVYSKYTAGVESLLENGNAATDVWKVALSNTINLANTTFVSGTTDLATAGGYTAGGNTCTRFLQSSDGKMCLVQGKS